MSENNAPDSATLQLVLYRLDKLDARLDKFETEQASIHSTLNTIKGQMVQHIDLDDLKKRVRDLEDFKLKTVTILVFVQVLLMTAWAVASKILLK